MSRYGRARDLGTSTSAHVSFICACGKRAYRSERLCLDAHKRFHWRIRVYRCPDAPSLAYHATNHEKNG